MKKRVAFIQFVWKMGCSVWLLFAVKSFYEALPNQIYVSVGDQLSYHFSVPVTVEKKEEYNTSHYVTCKLFGVFPVKDIEVTFKEDEAVFAGGSMIGIYAKTDGVYVLGIGEVFDASNQKQSPAKNIIKKGDYIVSVNGKPIQKKTELAKEIHENGGKTETIGLFRKDAYIEVAINPVYTKEGRYMLGVWVRDDMAGIGTITFYRKDLSYGALGHPVNDGDTGESLKLRGGSLYQANMIGIKRGESGKPGELSGLLQYGKDHYIGTIEKNSEMGIYGVLDGDLTLLNQGTYCEVAYKQEIKQGKAHILSALSGEIEAYEVEIECLNYNGKEKNKGILFQVTDQELLEKTGGIVQGMSGSPIIQDGKIIGAVTHVLVNDPTRGYGIFIEEMLGE